MFVCVLIEVNNNKICVHPYLLSLCYSFFLYLEKIKRQWRCMFSNIGRICTHTHVCDGNSLKVRCIYISCHCQSCNEKNFFGIHHINSLWCGNTYSLTPDITSVFASSNELKTIKLPEIANIDHYRQYTVLSKHSLFSYFSLVEVPQLSG